MEDFGLDHGFSEYCEPGLNVDDVNYVVVGYCSLT
jgi:hypothetical protein